MNSEAGDGDEARRREAESLLPAHEQAGSFLGMVSYISPGQARWQKVSARTDTIRLGVLHEMVARRMLLRADRVDGY